MDSSFSYTMCVAATSFFALLVILFLMFYKNCRFVENNQIENSTSLSVLSLPSSLPRSWIHDVFPSFHGADVRNSFLSHVLKEFKSKGITPFIDNEIKRGEFIGHELIEAIKGSRIAVVLLSKRYASSSWCLDELVEIINGKEDCGQTVMVIFYKVDPTDVKKQTGEFGKVFRKTCIGKTMEVVGRWKQALAKVATIAGYHSSSGVDEATMIEKIADDISKLLNHLAPSPDLGRLIGMEAHMERMKLLLRLDLEHEVKMIGIWGPPGIGKSTIARFLFNQFSRNFPLSAIMVNIKGNYPRPCFDEGSAQLQLQNQMLSLMINHKDTMITHLGVAQARLKDRRVLLVLDDVDRRAQLDALAGDIRWFGPGSRIIITTEDQRILKDHGIKLIYKVDYPIDDEALQIFCMHAFGQKSPKYGFEVLAREVTKLSGKLPLALTVMGSYFRGMSEDNWKSALPILRNRLDGKIGSILKFSYDALSDEDKNVFLHIACFFNGEEVEKVEEHLAKKFLIVRQRLQVLAEKSLISIDGRWIIMHTLLVQLGKEIVREQSDCKQQFLIGHKDICEVLTDRAAVTRSVIGISSHERNELCVRDELNITKRAFEVMPNLQFLRFRENFENINIMSWRRRLKYISPKLQLLDWPYWPMTCLRCIVNTELLVELNLPNSKLKKLWEGIKPLQNLKWINLRNSKHLKKLPNLSTATNLQELLLDECISLIELPFSIGNALNLQKLDLRSCSSLVELPSSIGNATNLQTLCLSKCSSLLKLPSSIGNATNLKTLYLDFCSSLVELPCSIENATNLQELYLNHCSSLVELPSGIGNATNLKTLYLDFCSSLVELPYSIGNATNLQTLNLSRCLSLVKLPSSIGNATNLRDLDLTLCIRLVKVPSSIGNATNLQKLNLQNCSSLVGLPFSIGNATNLQELNLQNCSSLVELPSSIGNLHKLTELILRGCYKLEVIPTNINLESLIKLDLEYCCLLKSFPEISTNIEILKLRGFMIKEVPSSIRSWSRLEELEMTYSANLKESPHAFASITALYTLNLEMEEIGLWVKDCSRLVMLNVSSCRKLVSLPQLPDSLIDLDAENCVSLERLDCSFRNPNIKHLNFGNCFRLNQEARDLIIQTSTCKYSVLPGEEVPVLFTYKAYGSFLTMELNEKTLRTSTRFRACILLDYKDEDGVSKKKKKRVSKENKDEDEAFSGRSSSLSCWITSKQKDRSECRSFERYPQEALTNHLYIFDFEAEEVTSSTKLVFEFKVQNFCRFKTWKIKECGIVQL